MRDTYEALRDVLKKMKDKPEFCLKVNWDRETVLAEVEQECEEIRRLKVQIESDQALAHKSESFVHEIYDVEREKPELFDKKSRRSGGATKGSSSSRASVAGRRTTS